MSVPQGVKCHVRQADALRIAVWDYCEASAARIFGSLLGLMGRFADLLDSPSESKYALRPNDKNDKSPPSVVWVVTTKTTKEPFGRFGRSVVARKSSPDALAELDARLAQLEARCPDYVQAERWRQCVLDARRFLAAWGDKALALGWDSGDLFGLHEPPARPRPSYSRLSRRDCTGLLWTLEGRRVIALTTTTAAIESPSGAVVTYRRNLQAR